MTRLHWMAAALLLAACGRSTLPHSSGSGTEDGPESCPATRPAPAALPGVDDEHRTASYWIARSEDPDRQILTPAQIADHNAALAAHDAAHPDDDPLAPYDLAAPEDRARLDREIDERLAFLRERVGDGRYVDAEGKAVAAAAFERRAFSLAEEVRVALADIPLRCGPRAEGLYKAPEVDHAFDRNACSTLRIGEPVKILATWGGMKLARTPYALGFIAEDAPLSPTLGGDDLAAFTRGPVVRLAAPATLAGVALPAHARLPKRGDHLLVATAKGVEAIAPPKGAAASDRPLTRRALFEEAFRYLDSAYGWGGQNGGRDCSRFLLDVFASFGLSLPRHSGQQKSAGSMVIDVTEAASERERLGILDAAARRGIVLLHFPGHVMLYLGRAEDGRPMAIHAFAEYLERCETPAGERTETRRTVDRIQVSDLGLGAQTSRRSFLERITHVTVFGTEPGPELAGAVTRRPAAPMLAPAEGCKGNVALFTVPRRPHPGVPLRVVATASRDLGSVEMAFFDPDGKRHAPPLRRLGGPPFGYWTEVAAPKEGRWTVQIGEGARVEACEKVTVHARGDARQAAGGSVWRPQRAWDPATEGLFSAFVEQLFAYPLDDRTWPSLQALLADRDHNLLHGHLGQGEDDAMALQPDCADLPYFLRAYFAWKMRLPFAFRHCNRGRAGKAPYCDRELKTHLDPIEDASTETRAFFTFARRNVADGVHSGSGRTAPEDEHTDYYPLPLTREALRPGVIFADPYGHLFVIAGWVPQGIGTHGILVGADAQPDGTIGRRRFWPGSFLFTPDTKEAGAGFKAFRPVRYRGGHLTPVKNADIAALGLPAFSLEQHSGTKEDFYDRVEALINPRPLDPKAVLDVLVDALHEQVKRRVISVQNAEDYKASHRGAIEMPTGHSIFETTGPWEDYATPSRDMRLLIAIDTVLGFVDALKRNPARFGIGGAEVGRVAGELEAHLEAELRRRTFSYRKSDGATQSLTVADVIARAAAFELAYNPNDCVEIRWAAPSESPEHASCRDRAPAHQRERMESYRAWFANRQRPAR